MGSNELPVEWTLDATSAYKGSDCGSVKPLPMADDNQDSDRMKKFLESMVSHISESRCGAPSDGTKPSGRAPGCNLRFAWGVGGWLNRQPSTVRLS